MNAMQLLTGPVAQALGWALLHLLWQATIVAGILAAVLALLPRRSANARYLASIAALALVFAMFVTTAVRTYDPGVAPIAHREAPVEATKLDPASVPVILAAIATEGWRERLAASLAAARQTLPSVVGLWLAGVVLLSARLLVSWMRARSLVRRGATEAGAHWQRAAERISAALGLRRAVRLLESAAIEVPSVIGSLRPVILLPASTLTGLTPQQIEMVLAHELAHIRRHDFFVNLLQAFVETLMFYHPAVWWMSRRVRIERENCCDDLAVAVCGDPIQYARALTRLEELRDHALPVAVAANGGSLLDRIRRIAADRAESTGISSRWAAAAAMLAIVATIVALPSLPALAQREKKAAASTPAATSVDVVEKKNAGDDADHDIDADDGDLEAPEPPEMPVVADLADLDFEFDIPPVAPVAPVAMVAPMAMVAPAAPAAPMARVAGVAPRAIVAAPPAPPAIAPAPAPPHPPAAPAPRVHDFDFDFDFDFGDDTEDREIGAGGTFSVDELIALRAAGVTPESIDAMRRIFPRLRLREAMSLSAAGVTPEFIREMRGAGFAVENPREAVILAATGVKPEWVREM
ncbi:MAG TPA: M56 family metallopeptidase, partial [Thermoanaerobaculia bacterium]|nr:M56 family metallopeptidase [Thermoanaerobaculia bacterium]